MQPVTVWMSSPVMGPAFSVTHKYSSFQCRLRPETVWATSGCTDRDSQKRLTSFLSNGSSESLRWDATKPGTLLWMWLKPLRREAM
eukprot:1554208-Lingulodinium_polyedra.AAC.1